MATSLLVGCEDELPTATGPGLVPGSPESIEIFFEFDEIAGDLQVFDDFASVASLQREVLAREWAPGGIGSPDTLNSRVLARFSGFPRTIQAVDQEGTTRTDSLFTVIGGRVTVQLDTAAILVDSVALAAGAVTAPWDPRSATWELAVDTVGASVPWPEAGAGPVTVQDTAVWRRAEGVDSVFFDVDSATVAQWMDEEDPERGVRIELADSGLRFEAGRVNLLLLAQPSFEGTDPVFAGTGSRVATFVYDPPPPVPADGMRFGGAPAWRTVFRLNLPETLTGPQELCAVAQCPLELSSDQITYAALQLTTRAISPIYRASDSLSLELRGVLRPDLLPRSPLGQRPIGVVGGLPPEVFGDDPGELVEVPLTSYMRTLVDAGSDGGAGSSNMLALLSPTEPRSFSFGEFYGSGGAVPPRFRLILTLAEEVDLP